MNIAICDDDRDLCLRLSELLKEQPADGEPNHVKIFHSGEALWFSFDEYRQPFDLVVLNVEISGANGLEAAKRIRKRNSNVSLILITSHPGHAIAGYEAQPFRLLLKPLKDKDFLAAFHSVVNERKKKWSEYLNLKASGRFIHVPLAKIVYAESRNQNIFIHTVNDSIKLYRKLSDILPLLDNRFVQCHKSYLINLDYLEQVTNGYREIHLQGLDTIVPVSNGYRKAFLQTLSSFSDEH